MATDYWCDFATGSDATGDGSMALPFKTPNKGGALTLQPGDHMHIGQSPADTPLPGTYTFTKGSATVISSEASGLLAGDFIVESGHAGPGDPDKTPWEVTVVVGNTITIGAVYSGSTKIGVAAMKLGVTDCGSTPQAVSSAGSAGTPALIDGGWNLATGLQTGHTWFMLSGAKPSWGTWGLLLSGSYGDVQHVGLLRWSCGYFLTDSSHHYVISHTTSNSSASDGIFIDRCNNQTVSECVLCANGRSGILVYSTTGIVLDTVRCDSQQYGIYGYTTITTFCIMSIIEARYCSVAGIRILQRNSRHTGVTMSDCGYGVWYCGGYGNQSDGITCLDCVQGVRMDGASWGNVLSGVLLTTCTTGLYSTEGVLNTVNDCSFVGCGAEVTAVASQQYSELPAILLQSYGGTDGDNRLLFEYGEAQRDTANQPFGLAECLALTPSSATYYISTCGQDDTFIAIATASTELTLSLLMKKSADYNGGANGVILEAYVDGKLTDTVVPTLTTSYATYTVTVAAGDIPRSGPCVALRVRVRGTVGSVYLSTFGWA